MTYFPLSNTGGTSSNFDDAVLQLQADFSVDDDVTLYTFVDCDNSTILIDGSVLMTGSGLDPALLVDADSSGTQLIVSETGRIISTQDGIEFEHNSAVLINDGFIQAQNVAISTSGVDPTIRNFGTITGNSGISSSSSLILYNAGSISSFGTAVSASDSATIQNDGQIASISSAMLFSGGNSVVQNNANGQISSDFSAIAKINGGLLEVINAGSIVSGSFVIATDASDVTLVNSGELTSSGSSVILIQTSGILTMTNSGVMGTTNALAIDAAQATVVDIVNTGEIIGDLVLGGGDDTVLNLGQGVIAGVVQGGDGNDTILGGTSSETIDGGSDSDYISGGEGDDALTTGAGIDIVLGGAGDDSITVSRGGTKFLLGQAGADTFYFLDSSVSPPGGEITSILDFESGIDIIDFYAIASGIAFVGEAGFSAGGGAEIATKEIGGAVTLAQLDVNGDGTAELEILVYGAIDMTLADFGL